MPHSARINGIELLSFSYDRDATGRITSIPRVRVRRGRPAQRRHSRRDSGCRGYGDTTYIYTPNGDLESATVADEITRYEYDAFGNLRKVTWPGGTTVEYSIDGQNRRVGRKLNGVATHGWLYGDQLRIVAELNASGTVVGVTAANAYGNLVIGGCGCN